MNRTGVVTVAVALLVVVTGIATALPDQTADYPSNDRKGSASATSNHGHAEDRHDKSTARGQSKEAQNGSGNEGAKSEKRRERPVKAPDTLGDECGNGGEERSQTAAARAKSQAERLKTVPPCQNPSSADGEARQTPGIDDPAKENADRRAAHGENPRDPGESRRTNQSRSSDGAALKPACTGMVTEPPSFGQRVSQFVHRLLEKDREGPLGIPISAFATGHSPADESPHSAGGPTGCDGDDVDTSDDSAGDAHETEDSGATDGEDDDIGDSGSDAADTEGGASAEVSTPDDSGTSGETDDGSVDDPAADGGDADRTITSDTPDDGASGATPSTDSDADWTPTETQSDDDISNSDDSAGNAYETEDSGTTDEESDADDSGTSGETDGDSVDTPAEDSGDDGQDMATDESVADTEDDGDSTDTDPGNGGETGDSPTTGGTVAETGTTNGSGNYTETSASGVNAPGSDATEDDTADMGDRTPAGDGKSNDGRPGDSATVKTANGTSATDAVPPKNGLSHGAATGLLFGAAVDLPGVLLILLLVIAVIAASRYRRRRTLTRLETPASE